MDRLTYMFVEDPLGVYLVLIAVGMVLVAVWGTGRNPKVLLAAGAVAAAALLVAVLDLAVTTDRERIRDATDAIVDDLERGQWGVLAERMAEDYSGLGVTRTGALSMASRGIGGAGIRDITLQGMAIVITGDSATQTFSVFVEANRPAYMRWRIHWARRDDTWMILHAGSPKAALPGSR